MLPTRPEASALASRNPDLGKSVESKQSEGLLNCTPNTRHPSRNVFACAARAVAGIGRILLLLIAILLVTTPLTQCLWTWDHFLRGGQDYESSTLMVLAFLCLVLVLARHCQQSVDLLLTARRQFSFLSPDPLLARASFVGVSSAFWTERVAGPDLKNLNLPLQI